MILLLVDVFSVLQHSTRYICKNVLKITTINENIDFDVFWFFIL